MSFALKVKICLLVEPLTLNRTHKIVVVYEFSGKATGTFQVNIGRD